MKNMAWNDHSYSNNFSYVQPIWQEADSPLLCLKKIQWLALEWSISSLISAKFFLVVTWLIPICKHLRLALFHSNWKVLQHIFSIFRTTVLFNIFSFFFLSSYLFFICCVNCNAMNTADINYIDVISFVIKFDTANSKFSLNSFELLSKSSSEWDATAAATAAKDILE